MRNGLIHFIVYSFVLIICFVINELINHQSSIVPITFGLGWFTYPLIKYLQKDETNT